MRFRYAAPILFFAVVAVYFKAEAQKNFPKNEEGVDTHTYKEVDDTALNLYVFKPANWRAEDRRPAVVFFFGGGWSIGNPGQFKEQCRYLSDRGMVAITADYRVSSRYKEARGTDCVSDARDAVHWIRSHASELGIDPNRLAAGGGSAGGHLAACLGTVIAEEDENLDSVPNALILLNPACVLAPIDGKQPWGRDLSKAMAKKMGVPPVDLSPAHHVRPGCPPCIVLHGTSDRLVPFDTSRIFAEKMQSAGNICELKSYEGAGHGFFNFGRKGKVNYFEETMKEVEAFLTRLKWLPVIEEEKDDS